MIRRNRLWSLVVALAGCAGEAPEGEATSDATTSGAAESTSAAGEETSGGSSSGSSSQAVVADTGSGSSSTGTPVACGVDLRGCEPETLADGQQYPGAFFHADDAVYWRSFEGIWRVGRGERTAEPVVDAGPDGRVSSGALWRDTVYFTAPTGLYAFDLQAPEEAPTAVLGVEMPAAVKADEGGVVATSATGIWVMHDPTVGFELLTETPAFDLDLDPEYVYFAGRGTPASIQRIARDGGEPETLHTLEGISGDLLVTPHGLFVSETLEDGTGRLSLLEAGDAVVLDHLEDAGAPSMAPTPEGILFAAGAPGEGPGPWAEVGRIFRYDAEAKAVALMAELPWPELGSVTLADDRLLVGRWPEDAAAGSVVELPFCDCL